MFINECTKVYVDSGYIKLPHNQHIIKTGIIATNPNFTDVRLSATRFAKKGLTSNFAEACGVRIAYDMFGSLASYYTDCLALIKHKNKFFKDIDVINLYSEVRWNPNMIIADSIARRGVQHHVKISKTKELSIALKRKHHRKSIYHVAFYQYGTLTGVTTKTKLELCNLQIPDSISIQDYNEFIDKILTCSIKMNPVFIL